MKNRKKWEPSRIIPNQSRDGWMVDKESVAACSRFIVTLQTPLYVQSIKDYATGKLLDCGCGRVPYYGIYKDLVNEVECIDWGNSPHEIRYADKFADLNEGLPYADSHFDTVLLSDVLEHIYAPTYLISEISRVLTSNGTLICFVPFTYWLHEDPYDYNRYTEYALRKMCDENGLIITNLVSYGGGMDIVFDAILKINRNRLRTVQLLTSLFLFIRKTRLYKKNSAWGLKKMPLGYILIAQKQSD